MSADAGATPDALFARLAAGLPDIPRWVEARSMLLRRECDIIGLDEKPVLSYLLRDRETHLVVVAGEPKARAIREAVGREPAAGEVLCQFEAAPAVMRALPEWQGSTACLHRLGSAPRLPSVPAGAVRLLGPDEISSLDNLPAPLKSELMVAAGRSPVAAVSADGAPVCFCYAGALTERLWDVSIDTLAPYRGQGYAALCVSFMIERMRDRGREPVWGTLDANEASLALAARLGFVPVDRVLVFQRPERG